MKRILDAYLDWIDTLSEGWMAFNIIITTMIASAILALLILFIIWITGGFDTSHIPIEHLSGNCHIYYELMGSGKTYYYQAVKVCP